MSYLTARPSQDKRVAVWQEITKQWWEEERQHYELFASELVHAEASEGDPEAAEKRIECLKNIVVLVIDSSIRNFADLLIAEGAVPVKAEADALHIATAAVHQMDYLLTWNCRHIDNAAKKPIIRSICVAAGYNYPEICTPLELLAEE